MGKNKTIRTYHSRSILFHVYILKGQVIISNGMPPPQPWDIMVQPVAMFKDEVRLIEIPNTAQVEVLLSDFTKVFFRTLICLYNIIYILLDVYKVFGCRKKVLLFLFGTWTSKKIMRLLETLNLNFFYFNLYLKTSCTSCHGHGHHHHNNERHTCSSCHGSGWRRCFSCDGTGMITCRCCKGSGRLKWYLQLKVEFKNNRDDFFKKSEQIPDELLRKCTSKNIYTEQNIRVRNKTKKP